MEIIVLPYLAISFAVAWIVFSPFAVIEGLDEWSFSNIQTGDLLATFVPLSLFLAMARFVFLKDIPWVVTAITLAMILAFIVAAFATSLYLLAKMEPLLPLKRLALVGIVIPLGSFLVIGWVGFPLAVMGQSILWSIPATLALVPFTFLLRLLSLWICKLE